MTFRRPTGDALRAFTQALMRGDSSLSAGEREVIATTVSARNACTFCATSHDAVVRKLGEKLDQPSPKMQALLAIAEHVRTNVAAIPQGLVDEAHRAGADDVALHDAVLVTAAFSMFNRYVEGLGVAMPSEQGYDAMAERLAGEGYASHPKDVRLRKSAAPE
jgi:uncharacterized peroxidase-related enzyme